MVTVTELNRAPDGRFKSLEATGTINTADIQAASTDEVIKKSSSGSDLKFGTVQTEPNVPNWEEDPNSPFTASSTSSITATLANSYDVVQIFAEVTNPSSFEWIDIQFNGDTGTNYDFIDNSGSKTLSASDLSQWMRTATGGPTRGVAKITTGQGDGLHIGVEVGKAEQQALSAGQNSNISPPLDSLTLTTSITADWRIEVFGRDVQ